MPGRLMSLIVIGTRDSRPCVRTSSDSVSRCCSKSCAVVIWAVLIELKQPHLTVPQPIGDADPSALRLREDEDRRLGSKQRLHRLIHGQGAMLGARADHLHPI